MRAALVEAVTFRRGQRWRNRATGRVIILSHRASGMKHWSASSVPSSRKSHHIHEGTLAKFYVLEARPNV